MATEDWIEEALEDVFGEIQNGSSLAIGGHRELYKTRYREDFRRRTEEEWKQNKDGVLRLARLVGSMATTLTIVEAVKRHYMPTEVDQRSADLAGYLIAKVKIADFPKFLGHFCQNYPAPSPGAEPTLRELQDVIDSLVILATKGRATSTQGLGLDEAAGP